MNYTHRIEKNLGFQTKTESQRREQHNANLSFVVDNASIGT